MKAMFRRLRLIEALLAPKPNAVAQRAVDLLRERRWRGLEAEGKPYEELLWDSTKLPPDLGRLSAAETLRLRRRRSAQERNATPMNAMATDIAGWLWQKVVPGSSGIQPLKPGRGSGGFPSVQPERHLSCSVQRCSFRAKCRKITDAGRLGRVGPR